jgi:hypothetical protein
MRTGQDDDSESLPPDTDFAATGIRGSNQTGEALWAPQTQVVSPSMLAPLSLSDLLTQGGLGLSLGFRLDAGSLGQVGQFISELTCASFKSWKLTSLFQMSRRDA